MIVVVESPQVPEDEEEGEEEVVEVVVEGVVAAKREGGERE